MDAAAALKKFQAQEAARIRSYTSKAGTVPPQKYAAGGAVKSGPVKAGKGGTTINISVGGKEQQQPPNPMAAMALANALKPKLPPVTMTPPAPPQGPQGPQGGAPQPPMGAPGMGAVPGLAGIAGGMMPGMKKGGRATALPMTAGAMSGVGREQKADSEAKKEGKREPAEPKARKGIFR